MQKICLLLMIFLTSSCQTAKRPVTPIAWHTYEIAPGEFRACLPEPDVETLAERLKRCEQAARK